MNFRSFYYYASRCNLKLTFLLFIFAVLSSIGCNTISNVSFSHSFLSTYRYYVCEDSKALAKAVSVLFFSVENFLLFEYLFQCSHNQILIFLRVSSKIPQNFPKFLKSLVYLCKIPHKALFKLILHFFLYHFYNFVLVP